MCITSQIYIILLWNGKFYDKIAIWGAKSTVFVWYYTNLDPKRGKICLFWLQIESRAQKYKNLCLECFEYTSSDISHDLFHEIGPASKFPTLKRPQMAKN